MARFEKASPRAAGVDTNDWPSAQGHLIKQADAYHALSLDLEAITFPDTVVLNGESRDLGRDSTALLGWSRELETVIRQSAAGASFEAAMQDTVVFEGSSYPMSSFIQDATGEWGAALDLTARDLGLDPSRLFAPVSSPTP